MLNNIIPKLRNIIIGIFLIFFVQLMLPMLFEVQIDFNFWIIVIAIIMYFLLANFNDQTKLARNAFLLIALFGTVIAFIRPVQYALDEDSHLSHSIGLSDSLLFKYSDETLSDYDSVFGHDAIRNIDGYQGEDYWYSVEHKESKIKGTPVSFDNPAFLPGALGWNLGRILSEKIYVSYYLGRIFHVLSYAILVFIALKMSKSYQNVLYLMGTLPSAVYVIAGFHYDYLYYGASLILAALLTNVLSGKQKIDMKFVVIYQLISSLFIYSKFPFILMGSVLLFFGNEYFVSKKTRIFSGISFLLLMLFGLIYTGIINVFEFSKSVTGETPGLMYFIQHPLPIVRSMLSAPVVILDHFISTPLQYVTEESTFLYVFSLVPFILLYVLNIFSQKIKVPTTLKVYLTFLFLGITFLMIYAITGDPRVYLPGDLVVGGVQGRYYYLMLVFLPLILPEKLKTSVKYDGENLYIVQQYIISFLVILTICVGYYTQI